DSLPEVGDALAGVDQNPVHVEQNGSENFPHSPPPHSPQNTAIGTPANEVSSRPPFTLPPSLRVGRRNTLLFFSAREEISAFGFDHHLTHPWPRMMESGTSSYSCPGGGFFSSHNNPRNPRKPRKPKYPRRPSTNPRRPNKPRRPRDRSQTGFISGFLRPWSLKKSEHGSDRHSKLRLPCLRKKVLVSASKNAWAFSLIQASPHSVIEGDSMAHEGRFELFS